MGLHKRALKAMFPRNKWKILKGDSVMITAGKDAGQTGTVSKVHRDPKSPAVTVKGMNLYKKHIKRTQERPGGIVDIEKPITYSNIALLDPVTKAPCRSTWRYLEDGTKVRVTRGKLASGTAVARPARLARRHRTRSYEGKQDTPVAALQEVTYVAEELPQGLDRVASILAGRVRLPVVETDDVTSGAFHSPREQMAYQKSGSWRSFATDGPRR